MNDADAQNTLSPWLGDAVKAAIEQGGANDLRDHQLPLAVKPQPRPTDSTSNSV